MYYHSRRLDKIYRPEIGPGKRDTQRFTTKQYVPGNEQGMVRAHPGRFEQLAAEDSIGEVTVRYCGLVTDPVEVPLLSDFSDL